MGRRVDGEGVRVAAEESWRGASVLPGTGRPGFGRLGALLVPVLHAGLGHALADAALFDKVLLQATALLVEEIVGLMNEAEGDVCKDLGRAGFKERAISFKGFTSFLAEPADIERFFGIFVPDGVVADAEEVLIVEHQFLQAGPRDVDEFDFRLR